MSVTASMLWHKCESSRLLQYKHAGPHAGRLRERLILRAAETHWGCQLKHRKEPREQNTEQRNEKSCETKVSLQSMKSRVSDQTELAVGGRRVWVQGEPIRWFDFLKKHRLCFTQRRKVQGLLIQLTFDVVLFSGKLPDVWVWQWCLLLKIPTVTHADTTSLPLPVSDAKRLLRSVCRTTLIWECSDISTITNIMTGVIRSPACCSSDAGDRADKQSI